MDNKNKDKYNSNVQDQNTNFQNKEKVEIPKIARPTTLPTDKMKKLEKSSYTFWKE